jgi:hypothetical protein
MSDPTILEIPADGSGDEPYERPPTPEEVTGIAAANAQVTRSQQGVAFAASEDAERLRVINDRARTDPAYAALADIVLRGLSR